MGRGSKCCTLPFFNDSFCKAVTHKKLWNDWLMVLCSPTCCCPTDQSNPAPQHVSWGWGWPVDCSCLFPQLEGRRRERLRCNVAVFFLHCLEATVARGDGGVITPLLSLFIWGWARWNALKQLWYHSDAWRHSQQEAPASSEAPEKPDVLLNPSGVPGCLLPFTPQYQNSHS